MLFKTFIFAAITTLGAIVQADCTTGKILGKFAVCGSDPVDCGTGLCCQTGATCVSDDGAVFRCAMPLLSIDSTSNTNDTIVLNAGCYDVVEKQPTPSSTASSASPSNTDSTSSGQSEASAQNTSSKSKLSKGAIAGIVVGSVACGVIILAILAALLLLARRRRNNAPPAAAARREMGERSNSSNSGIQKPPPVVYGSRSSTAKPGPVPTEIAGSHD